jgi:hypothetical protein
MTDDVTERDHSSERAPRRAFDWMFRDRSTGKVVIAQWPNLPLIVFLVAAAIRRFASPEGTVGPVVSVVATAAILWWSVDEVARGVNPFRRILGGIVLVVTLVGLVATLA